MENTNIVSNQARKKTRGRQRIQMKKIEDEVSRIITFSKRKRGINKKLSEVVSMCGAEVAFVIFSPSGRPYTFAQPSIQAVVNSFLGRNNNDGLNPQTRTLLEASRKMRRTALVQDYNQLQNRLDTEQERSKTLESQGKYIPRGWWDAPMDQMNFHDLCRTYQSFMSAREKALNSISQRNAAAIAFGASSLSATPPQVMNPLELGINPLAPTFGHTPLGTNYFGLDGSGFDPTNSLFVPPTFNGNDVNPIMDFSIPNDGNLGTAPFVDYSRLAGAPRVASPISDFSAAFGTNRSAGPSPNVAFPPSFGFEGKH